MNFIRFHWPPFVFCQYWKGDIDFYHYVAATHFSGRQVQFKVLEACVEIPNEKYRVCDISLEFFTTDIYILASVEKVGAGILAESGYYYYSTKGLQKTHGRYMSNGQPERFDEATKQLLEKVVHRVNLAQAEQDLLTVFVCAGHEPIYRGTMAFKSGAVLGFPKHLMYTSEAEVTEFPHDLSSSASDLDGHMFDSLRKTLVLTEREKAFLVAKSIIRANQIDPFVVISMQLLYILSACLFLSYVNRFISSRSHPLLRFSIYGLVCASQVYMYFYSVKAFRNHMEMSSDKNAAKLTPFYAVGGLDYYTKLLERNKILRQMLREKGPALYTPKGNVVDELPTLTERKESLSTIVEKWEKGDIKVLPLVDRSNEKTSAWPLTLAQKFRKSDDDSDSGNNKEL